jgi:hypothetical protein
LKAISFFAQRSLKSRPKPTEKDVTCITLFGPDSDARRVKAIALPVYAVGLLLDYLSDALGRLAAWIAGDDWP